MKEIVKMIEQILKDYGKDKYKTVDFEDFKKDVEKRCKDTEKLVHGPSLLTLKKLPVKVTHQLSIEKALTVLSETMFSLLDSGN